jgi:hypothetical protein
MLRSLFFPIYISYLRLRELIQASKISYIIYTLSDLMYLWFDEIQAEAGGVERAEVGQP